MDSPIGRHPGGRGFHPRNAGNGGDRGGSGGALQCGWMWDSHSLPRSRKPPDSAGRGPASTATAKIRCSVCGRRGPLRAPDGPSRCEISTGRRGKHAILNR
jgi:hypothetical protein